MLRLAGCSSGWRDCARGGRSAGRCSFVVAAASVAGMDVFSPKSRKIRQPGLSVGESADHRRTDEGVSRGVYAARKENARRGLTSQAAPCYNVDMKG